jgi:hypothetical protein
MKVLENLGKIPHVNVFSAIAKNKMLLLVSGKMVDVSHMLSNTSFIPLAEGGA